MRFGLDIGYGQTKLSFADPFTPPVDEVHPSGAARIELCDRPAVASSGGRPPLPRGAEVLVDGVEYGALIDPDALRGGMPVLHEDFPSSPQYMALYHGALSRLPPRCQVIDHLVTGLPVAHIRNAQRVESMTRRLGGVHGIQRGRTITVRKVSIVPQAIGAFMSASDQLPAGAVDNETTLVVDAGHFSIDYVVIAGGNFRHGVSGSIFEGGSSVIDEIAGLVKAKHGFGLGPERVFSLIRAGHERVEIGGKVLDMDALTREASALVAPRVVGRIRAAMRAETSDVTSLVLCGGSAGFFRSELLAAFKSARALEAAAPVLANAKGFRLYAEAED